ncbi:MAG: hypothetical protein ACP5PV_13030 [Methanothrix sp.]
MATAGGKQDQKRALGSCAKMDADVALRKAKPMKAEAVKVKI